jgi:hypothetical protein
MRVPLRLSSFVIFAVVLFSFVVVAQESKPAGLLNSTDLKKVVPATYFYRGQSASVQLRNSAGIRTKNDRYILVGLVDTSGYATDIKQKYQGFFITEGKIKVEGTDLVPGQYGFGFVGDKFLITDVGANDLFSVAAKQDDKLRPAVPLKIVEDGGAYKLYAGKKWVSLEVQ